MTIPLKELIAAGLVERVVDTDATDTATIEAPDPLTPASTTESLSDEFSPKVPPAPGAVLPRPILCSAETHRTCQVSGLCTATFPEPPGGAVHQEGCSPGGMCASPLLC